MDLVRAPEHPEREGDYVVEDCSASYRVWKVLGDSRGELSWEWNLKTIRRIHYHKNVEKLEVEAGRYAYIMYSLKYTAHDPLISWRTHPCRTLSKFHISLY